MRGTWPGAAPCPSVTCPPARAHGSATRSPTRCCPDSHILVYPIPALDGSLTRGRPPDQHRLVRQRRRRSAARRPHDRPGRHPPSGVDCRPGAATGPAVTGMRQAAADLLAPPIAEAIARTASRSSRWCTTSRCPGWRSAASACIGDAAFAVRPHAAAGTAKAAADGWALAEELTAAGGDVPAALAAWERRQLALGRRPAGPLPRHRRQLAVLWARFRPGDPRLIFGLYGPGN